MSGSGDKPKGWYGKGARAERKAAREARRADRLKGKRTVDPQTAAIRNSAARRLASLPTHNGQHDASAILRQAKEREGKRVDRIIARDRGDARKARLRASAIEEVTAGKLKNVADTVIGPTPEQLRIAEYRPVRIDKIPGSVRSVDTVRRVSANRVKQIYDRGVLTDDTYPAVLWYQRQFEACGMTTAASAAAWGEQIRGERAYGLMPKTAAQAEARANFRFARGFIPADMLGTFDLVVLDEMSIADAAREARCRYSNAHRMVTHAALLLLGGIVHLLPVRAVSGEVISPRDADDGAIVSRVGPAIDVDPIMLDVRGMFRPADEIAAIARGRGLGLSDDEIGALLDGAG